MINTKKNWVVIILIIAFGVVNFFNLPVVRADTAEEIQKSLDSLVKKQKAAQAELLTEQSKLSKNQSQISTTKSTLNKLSEDIARGEAELKNLDDRAQLSKIVLAEYMRQIYYANQDNDALVGLVLAKNELSDIVVNSDNMLSINTRINEALQVIRDAKTKTEQTKSELADQKDDHQEVLKSQQVVQAQISSDIQDVQDTLANIQKKFAQLQSDLNALLGTNYNAKDIKDAVSYASSKTGVPQGVLYGFLKRETNLGMNTGQCTYADVERVSVAGYKKYGKKYQASIDLLYKRKKIFEGILSDLGYRSKKISCTIPFASAGPNQGGAMGVAQFMSDTWLAYESRISSNTGHKNPDPWNITDGVMALAIKVAGAGGTSDSSSAIRKATINYYGIFSQGYYDVVLYWSKNYKQLI
ncbi:MAG: lytic murein transglycosylase [Parcubacteria group bacterium]|jgi:peptidoglycan hydrolase CwlO-like protein